MAMIETETRSRAGRCPDHGDVSAEKQVPRVRFPFLITGPARMAASVRPYRCPACGAKAPRPR